MIEATIRYLTTAEGGRMTGVYTGYRGQFYYKGKDYDGFQYFTGETMVDLGEKVKSFIKFMGEKPELRVGETFEIREGRKVVGNGIITKVLI